MAVKIKKIARLLWEITYRTLTIGVALFFMLASFLFWRLSNEPLDLEFLIPEIQKYILPEKSQLKLKADSVFLSARMTRSGLFHISIKNMSLLGKDDALILDLPTVELSYGLLPLLTLNYMPSSIRLDNALLQLTLTRDEQLLLQRQLPVSSDSSDSADGISGLTSSQPAIKEKALVVHDLRRFADTILQFRRVILNKTSIIIADEKTGRRIIVPQLNFTLKRRRFTQYELDIDTAIRMGRDLMAFKGNALYNAIAQTIEFDAFYDRVNLSRAGRVIPLLEGLQVLLRGEINGSLDITEGRKHWRNAVKSLNFTVNTIQPGVVQLPEPLGTVYSVEKIIANGVFTENLNGLKIQPVKASLTTGLAADVDIMVNGIGDFLDQNNFNLVKTTLNARMNNIPMKEVPSVWPSTLGPDAHEWVKQNLKTGIATKALFTLYFTGADIEDLIGDIDFKETTVDYLNPMKPVENAAGKVMLYPDKVEIFADKGTIGNIRLNTGNVYLTELQSDISQAKVELDITGPVNEVLSLINDKPLELLAGFDISPDKTKGTVSGQATLNFPLTDALTPKDVIVDVKASVSDGVFQTSDNEIKLTNAIFGILVNNECLIVQGTGTYQNLPLQIKWEEFFMPTDKKPTQSIYTISGTVPDLFLKTYFSDISDYMIGHVSGYLIYQKSKNKAANILVNADLSQAELMLYPIAYTKVKGVPAILNSELYIDEKGEVNMVRFDLSADKKALDVAGLIQKEKTKTTLTLNKVIAPGTSFAAVVSWNDKKDFSLKLKGESWLMTEVKNMPYFNKQTVTTTDESISSHINLQSPPPDIDLDVSMDTITLNAQAPLKKVSVKAKRRGFTWKNLFIFAQGKDVFSVNLTAENNKLDGLANDIGDLLNRLDFSKEFAKGKAVLSATQSETGIFKGNIHIKNLDFKNPGFITQALTILGILDALRGKELTFSTGFIPFELSPRFQLNINDGVLYGTTLGITFMGTGSLNALKMSGSVIPAYAVNSLPGRIPFIGGLFRSAPNGGLMGVQYNLTGTPIHPIINFNPLSSIAPGILSKLFQ